MDYRQHLITPLHKNTGTEFWVFWSHGVFWLLLLLLFATTVQIFVVIFIQFQVGLKIIMGM